MVADISEHFPPQTLTLTTKARPQRRKLHALLFKISVWVLLRPLLTIKPRIGLPMQFVRIYALLSLLDCVSQW